MSKKIARRRRASAVMAVVVAIALVVTGTLAWRSISQRAVNNTEWEADATGARLHNDFVDAQNWVVGGNKDIYVENYSGQNPEDPSHVGQAVYVRVQLYEYMEIGQGAGLYNYPPETGDPVDYQDLDKTGTNAVRTQHPDNHAEPVIDGTKIYELDTWHKHIPGTSASEDGSDIDKHWDWKMGGSKVYMPTFNKDRDSLLTDRTTYTHDQFTVGATEKKPTTYADEEYDNQEETHIAESTLETAGVVTMAEWIALGKPAASPEGLGYWVGDTDGWYYWSKGLMPGDATGLLVDGMTLVDEPAGKSYYATHVISEMATAGDWGNEEDETGFYEEGITDEGLDLLERASGTAPTVTAISITESDENDLIFVKEGESISLTADVTVSNAKGDPGEIEVAWSITPDTDAFTDGTLTTEDGDAGDVYTVTVASAALPEIKTATAKVIVYPDEAVRVVGPMEDDKYYIDLGDNTYQEIKEDGTIETEMISAGLDTTIGNDDDKTPVSINKDGVKLLGPNDDESYYVSGEDGLLGTDDDVKMWPNPDKDNLVDYDPKAPIYEVILTKVDGTGTDTANTVKQGGTISYTAKVRITDPVEDETTDAADQTVKWELLGTHQAGTTIANTDTSSDEYTSGGVTLTVADDETVGANLLTLRATSREGTKVQTVNVSVAEKPGSPAANIPDGGTFADDKGFNWQVLTTDKDGNKLVMATSLYSPGIQYNTTNVWNSYEKSNVMKHATQGLAYIYTNSIGSDIKVVAMPVEINDNRTGVNTPDAFDVAENGETYPSDMSKAGSGTATAENSIFILSITEFNTYKDNIMYINNPWWLRTPGSTTSVPVAAVNTYGNIDKRAANNTTTYFRPALWLKS